MFLEEYKERNRSLVWRDLIFIPKQQMLIHYFPCAMTGYTMVYQWGQGFCGEKRWSKEVKELVSDASPKSSDKQKRKMVSDIIHQDCLIALP
jgi:hypothetical protein